MFNTPDKILEIQRFGVGHFTDEQLADKCQEVRSIVIPQIDSKTHPRLSVVVPAYNEEFYILATLKGLAQQTARDCEFIIVSNGEPYNNRTQQIAEASGFNVIHEPKKGIVLAREIGRRNAKGEIVVTTDADAIHPEAWLQSISDYMSDNPHLVAGTGRLHMLSDKWRYRALQEAWDITRMITSGHETTCMEGNSFFLRDVGELTTGYDVSLKAAEHPPLFRQFKKHGKIGFLKNPDVGVYVSDRRLAKMGLWGFLLKTLELSRAALFHRKVKDYPDIR